MKRNLQKMENEGLRILDASRKKNSTICITAGELHNYMERLNGEHPIEVLYDLWLFGLATGHRAGKRSAKA